MGRGEKVDPGETHYKVFVACVWLWEFGALFYLIGWLWGGNRGLNLGRQAGEGDQRSRQIFGENSG